MGVRPLLKPQQPVASGLPPAFDHVNRFSKKRKSGRVRQENGSGSGGGLLKLAAYYLDSVILFQITIFALTWVSSSHPFNSFEAEKIYAAIFGAIFAVYYIGSLLVFGSTPSRLLVKWTGLGGLIGAGMIVAAMVPKSWGNYKFVLENSEPVVTAVQFMSQNFHEHATPIAIYFKDEDARVVLWSNLRPVVMILRNTGGQWEYQAPNVGDL